MKDKNIIATYLDKYTYRVEWSEEDQAHLAYCLELPSVIAHGATVQDAIRELEHAVKASLDWMVEEKEEIPEPIAIKKYKGNLTLRVPPEVHKRLALRSAEEGVSINQYILSKILQI